MFSHVGFFFGLLAMWQERERDKSRGIGKFATDDRRAFYSGTSRDFLSNGVTIMAGQVLGNRETILADQRKVLARKERHLPDQGWTGRACSTRPHKPAGRALAAADYDALSSPHGGADDFRPWHERTKAMVDTDVLLVDDDKDTCASMSDILLDVGYTVDMAYDGAGALELSGRHKYRLALLDYKMPGMDGVELCRRLKNSQPSVVVALITAFSSVATTASSAEAGVWRTLVKPVNFSVLMPFVKEAVNARVGTPV